MKKRRVWVISLDGATWDIIDPLIKEGYLPNIAKLGRNGVSGKLRSTIPPLTCPAWLSYATGKNPGKIGVYDFLCRDSNSYIFRPFNFYKSLNEKAMWDILSENGARVGVMNIPTVYKPYPINGIIIVGMMTAIDERTGYMTPESANTTITHPPELKTELDEITDGYEINFKKTSNKFNIKEKIEEIYKITYKRLRAAQYLIEKYDMDFFNVVFMGVDRIQHVMWRYLDPVDPMYDTDEAKKYRKDVLKFWALIDKGVGDFIKKMDKNTMVIIMSDHGFGNQKKMFAVNEWLKIKGYLKLKEKSTHVRIPKIRKMNILLEKLGLKPIYKLLPKKTRKSISKTISETISFEDADIDWSKTKAYCHHFGQIYINLRGREPSGIVELGKEYEAVRNALIQDLRNIRDPQTNEKLNVEIFKSEDIYNGSYVGEGPDITIFADNLSCGHYTGFGYDSIITALPNSSITGTHRMEGIFIAYGRDIKQGTGIENAEIIDLAPTILHIMGVPVPEDMDGRVLKEIFKENSELAKREIIYQGISEKVRIKERIRGLKALGKV